LTVAMSSFYLIHYIFANTSSRELFN